MIRVLNAEPFDYSDEARAILRSVGELHEEALDRPRLLEIVPRFDVLIVRLAFQIDREVFEAGSTLKAIVTATTGLDHVDLDLAARRAVTVLSLRGEPDFLASIRATAEHTWALMLSLARRVPAAAGSVLAGGWDRDGFRGIELDGGCLGIIGLGRIGRQVAQYGRSFGMDVIAFDPEGDGTWPVGVERVATLDEVLRRGSVISVHVPLNDRTRCLIGAAELSSMRREAILVNTSRGEVIDSCALVEALAAGRIAGAALDVVDHERSGQPSPLIDWYRREKPGNVIVTPHIGGATHRSMARTEVFMARKLQQFLGARTQHAG